MSTFGPFRDQAAATREELLSLEQQRRDLDARIDALRGRQRKDPGHRTSLIIGAILALLSLGLWLLLASLCRFGFNRNSASLTRAEVVAVSAELYLLDRNETSPCPDVAALVASKKLEPKKSEDAWGRPYRIACSSEGVWAYSVGKDGIAHTADDIASDMPESNLETLKELSK
jgi:hypothetical protein